ncbi:MAG: chorismate-binding protein [Myxococcales bacterium]|nr:chorismate-binding protein [Myxococcales bacterium]
MTSPAQPQRSPPQPPANAARVEGVDAWEYLPLTAEAEVAFVWAHGDLTLVALGIADDDAALAGAGWPARVGGRSFDGGPGEGEWAGWPGAWRIRPRTIYAARRPGEVWRLGDPFAPGDRGGRPPAPLAPWAPLAADAFAPLEGLDQWIAATRRASAAIADGAAEKIVLARREVARCPGVGARGPALLPVLRDSNPEAVTFGIKLGADTGWFVGATPETLVAPRRRAG